jgi:hypothetical protein
MNIGNSSFERVEELKYFGTTLTYQNYIHEVIKGRLNSRDASYYSVQNFLSSSLLSKNAQNYYFVCCFVWACNMVSHTEGGT